MVFMILRGITSNIEKSSTSLSTVLQWEKSGLGVDRNMLYFYSTGIKKDKYPPKKHLKLLLFYQILYT